MSKKGPSALVKVKYHGCNRFYIYDEKEDRFRPIIEKDLSRASPGYTRLNEKARQREFDDFIKQSEIVATVKIPEFLPNAPSKPRLEKFSPGKKFSAAKTFLSSGSMFEVPRTGYTLLADVLCGLHCAALRKAEPSFSPTVAIRSDSPEIQSALKKLVKSIAWLSCWKSKKVKIERTAILDYRVRPGELLHHIQDFSHVKYSIPEYRKLCFPAEYADTVVLVIEADNAQLREATPYLSNASVVLLNCGKIGRAHV